MNNSNIEVLLKILPSAIRTALVKLDNGTFSEITELHIHASGAVSVVISGKSSALTNAGITNNLKETVRVSHEELENFIFRACHGSVYTHEESIKEGYITTDYGIRIGISGNCTTKNGNLIGFSKICGVSIRLPRHIDGASVSVTSIIEKSGFPNNKGILIASAPGVGKTTLLRDLSLRLSSGMSVCGHKSIFRVCVIDERNEIYMHSLFDNCCIDFLSNIPKVKGMEIATRVLSPEVIVLDEIGTESESKEIIKAHSGGVVLIASVHADSIESLYERPHIKSLLQANVFGAVYCLKRNSGKITGEYYTLNKETC